MSTTAGGPTRLPPASGSGPVTPDGTGPAVDEFIRLADGGAVPVVTPWAYDRARRYG